MNQSGIVKKSGILILLFFISFLTNAQISINTTGNTANTSAMLDVSSTDKGMLVPRMTTAQRTAISNPADALLVFDTTTDSFWYYNETAAEWQNVGNAVAGAHNLNELSDAIYDGSSLFLGGFTGSNDFGGNSNNAIGSFAFASNTTGQANTAFGRMALYSNIDGNRNIAIGYSALLDNTSGNDNIAMGFYCLRNNITGINNTVLGNNAGYSTIGSGNILIGYNAGYNETGSDKLYIENSSSSIPLIGGDFANDSLFFNGVVRITGGNPGANKILTSDEDGNATWEANSSATEINELSDAIYDGTSVFLGDGAGINDDGANSNTAIGKWAFASNTSGQSNAAFGRMALYSNIDGTRNIAIGNSALHDNTSGVHNIAIGYSCLINNITGTNNTVLGNYAGYNIIGTGNILIGYNAGYHETGSDKLYIENSSSSTPLIGGDFANDSLFFNGVVRITGGNPGANKILTSDADGNATWEANTAATELNELSDAIYDGSSLFLGYNSGINDDGSNHNVGIGKDALNSNISGNFNIAIGFEALQANQSALYNSAVGSKSLYNNTGERNTASGYYSLFSNTSGAYNTSLGYRSGYDNTTGTFNTYLGYNARANNTTAKTNSTAVGNDAVITASNQVRIGNASVTDIGGYADWTNISDKRFKYNISEDVSGLDFILKLRAVTYNLDVQKINNSLGVETENTDTKSVERKSNIRQSGFIAQEVEKAAKEIGFDFSGIDVPENENDHYGLRYAQFVVPLVKAIQEQQKMINQLQKENTEFKKLKLEIEELKKSMKRLQ